MIYDDCQAETILRHHLLTVLGCPGRNDMGFDHCLGVHAKERQEDLRSERDC